MKLLRKTEGFSLIEILVVIAIIGVLSAIVVPSFISGMPTRRLKSAARDLYGAMQQARLLAVKNNQNCTLRFGATSYYIDEDDDEVFDAGEKEVKLSIYNDVQFGSGTAPTSPDQLRRIGAHSSSKASSITFISAGTAEFSPDLINGDNTVYLQNINNPSKSFAVSVQLSGASKISRFDGHGEWE
ncbi:MAG: type II secretion system protein GspH [Candidatus Electrothrix sp. AX5]|nr:type II secretion system protein GspH [Candidatus Electrothrix sp. AX5]